jgi:hypothetical protein
LKGETVMATQIPEMESVMARLNKLESHNRWLKRAGAMLFILGVIALAAGARSVDDTVKAREFQVVDSDDNVRARLFTDDMGSHLYFLDKKGTPVLLVSTGDTFQGVVCNDRAGHERTVVTYDNNLKMGVIVIRDAQGRIIFHALP